MYVLGIVPKEVTMEKIVLKRSERRPLAFEGELLASYETSPNQASSRWSGSPGRWQETRVYRSKSGKYILHRARMTQWEGERNRFEALVFNDLEDLIGFLEEVSPQAAFEITQEMGLYEEV